MHIFSDLKDSLEQIRKVVGREIFKRWAEHFHVMVDEVVFDYAETLRMHLDN